MQKAKKYFLLFLIFGIASIFFNQTWFVPDEYWQSLEIAHSVVFKYGYRTWEWHQGIRSAAYPLMLSALYLILQLTSLDYVQLLTYLPRFIQIILSSYSYLHTCKLSVVFHGNGAFEWTALCIMSSWILFYSMNRTLYNSTEAALTMIGLSFFPWKEKRFDYAKSWKFISVAALATIIRPTALIIWIPVIVYHFMIQCTKKYIIRMLVLYFIIGVSAITLQVSLDFIFYKRYMFTPYNFLHFNFIHNLSIHYGSHPWHWYLTQGIPQLFTTHLLLVIRTIWRRPFHPLMLLSYWIIAIYSNLDHKEFRFLLPVVLIVMCVLGGYLAHISRRNAKRIVMLLFASNIPLALYFGLIHQRGSLDVVSYIASKSHCNSSIKIMFLMPCHSTPFYSHIHRNISLDFLTCEPNLNNESNYVDVADRFYINPLLRLSEKYEMQSATVGGLSISEEKYFENNFIPSHIILFDSLVDDIKPFLKKYHFSLCREFFHAHFVSGRVGRRIFVWCR